MREQVQLPHVIPPLAIALEFLSPRRLWNRFWSEQPDVVSGPVCVLVQVVEILFVKSRGVHALFCQACSVETESTVLEKDQRMQKCRLRFLKYLKMVVVWLRDRNAL